MIKKLLLILLSLFMFNPINTAATIIIDEDADQQSNPMPRKASKPLSKDQKLLLKPLSIDIYKNLLEKIRDHLHSKGQEIIGIFDVYKACYAGGHVIFNDIIKKWLDENKIDSKLFSDICACSIFGKCEKKSVDWNHFVQRILIDKPLDKKQLKELVLRYLFENPHETRANASKDAELRKLMDICRMSDHKAFSEEISKWALANNNVISTDFCICKFLCSDSSETLKILTKEDVVIDVQNESKENDGKTTQAAVKPASCCSIL